MRFGAQRASLHVLEEQQSRQCHPHGFSLHAGNGDNDAEVLLNVSATLLHEASAKAAAKPMSPDLQPFHAPLQRPPAQLVVFIV